MRAVCGVLLICAGVFGLSAVAVWLISSASAREMATSGATVEVVASHEQFTVYRVTGKSIKPVIVIKSTTSHPISGGLE